MRAASQKSGEWIEGFLFVGNRPILDFLNTRPVLAQGPVELLKDFDALRRWWMASGMVNSAKVAKALAKWRSSPEGAVFLKELLAFRERLRDAVLRMESGSSPSGQFVKEVNARLFQYPLRTTLRRQHGRITKRILFDPLKPTDLWAPIIEGTADLLTETDIQRLRRCESCVVHFFDTSKKGSRRWCSMNLCGNKIKVAAYQHRKRVGHSS